MHNFPLALPRLVRDYVSPVHPPSKSTDDLPPRTHAKSAEAALPGFQRCASAENSTGWVTPEELLVHRHATRRLHSDMPKLTSSWDVDAELQEQDKDACYQENKADIYHDALFTPLSPAAASEAFTHASSSVYLRASSSSSDFGRLSSQPFRAPSTGLPSVSFTDSQNAVDVGAYLFDSVRADDTGYSR
ncbi:hypothetical protein T484DRAFT_1892619 [Baffinella frigidus]|nr:hypothetical protein T484DRAFT_1892619 [Cryptophyta sp. CCMP2293]